jgi:hypothetical protein
MEKMKQEQAKRTIHISWNEAQRAETERENVRRARYKSMGIRDKADAAPNLPRRGPIVQVFR